MLELNDLTIGTKDGKTVAEHITLTLLPGTVTVLIGPNGSGKSSLLFGIMGHPSYRLLSGSIHIDKEDVTALPTEQKARKGIFLSLQHTPEIPGVTMVSFLHRAYTRMTGREISIPDFYKELKLLAQSLGVDEGVLKRELNTGFSGGEKKVSEILQMALLKPKYALLDEIDSGVDIDARKRILAGIERVKKEKTGILLITHYANLLSELKPDQVIVMAKGRVAAVGKAELAEDILANGFSKYE